jgi:hypothetical protein
MPFVNSARSTFGPSGRFGSVAKLIATGGTITTVGSYKIHTFNADGNFVVSSVPASATLDILMVGGGGGGGATSRNNCGHGGGGAGGLIYRTSQTITAGTYAVVIGTGGIGCINDSTNPKANATNGNNTTFNGLTALGGGGANCGNADVRPASNGGSGGGGQHSGTSTNFAGGNALQPGSASGGFGFKGGDGPLSSAGSPCWYGGGGGGAGAAGTNGSANVVAPGGIGKQYDISGTSSYYAGGGGAGACEGGCSDSNGGLGGGGLGTGGTHSGKNLNGGANTGGGGGGLTFNGVGATAGTGGTGVVIVRYIA